MVKPLVLVLAVAALISSSSSSLSWAATLPASEEVSSSSPAAHRPLLGPSTRVRKAAAAGVPPHERKLQFEPEMLCYVSRKTIGVPPVEVSCIEVGQCSAPVKCIGTACLTDALASCEKEPFFKVTTSPLQYSCCTIRQRAVLPVVSAFS
jgi:hypothetical protein